MKFRWDKKYLYWGVTGFAVICASLLFYFGLFHMDVLWGKIHNLFTVLMPVVWGVIIAYLLTPIVFVIRTFSCRTYKKETCVNSLSGNFYFPYIGMSGYLFFICNDCAVDCRKYYQYCK